MRHSRCMISMLLHLLESPLCAYLRSSTVFAVHVKHTYIRRPKIQESCIGTSSAVRYSSSTTTVAVVPHCCYYCCVVLYMCPFPRDERSPYNRVPVRILSGPLCIRPACKPGSLLHMYVSTTRLLLLYLRLLYCCCCAVLTPGGKTREMTRVCVGWEGAR